MATDPDVADLASLIGDGLSRLDRPTPPDSAERLAAYLDLLQRWNRAFNLSAIRDPRDMVTRHVLDSLAIRPWLRGDDLLDLGTGPGLPGLVVAVVEPERQVTLLDSNGKKTRFLEQAVIQLGLGNVRVVRARAEQWRDDARFASVTSRAFTELAAFWRSAAPVLAHGGAALAMKGRYPEAELAALPVEGLSWRVHRIAVPGLDAERHLVIVEPDDCPNPSHRDSP